MQIMCLVSERTREVAHERNACAVLLAKLEADVEEGTLAGACLDTLLALLADSPLNQQDFLAEDGLARVTLSASHIRGFALMAQMCLRMCKAKFSSSGHAHCPGQTVPFYIRSTKGKPT